MIGRAGALGLAAAFAAAPAIAAPRAFDVAPQPYATALIELALQANVSLLGAEKCPGASRIALRGRFTTDEALGRLLAGSGCGFRMVDARTVRILPPARGATPTSEPPRSAAPQVSELVVTATKRRLPAERIAAAVSVVSAAELDALGAGDGRRTTQLAGVLSTNLGPGRDKLLVRGLSDGVFTGRARATVGTYLDSTPINYDAPDPDLRLTDVERVEVVRGPQGALYGDGALAGVYRIVTRKPDPAQFAAGLSATYARTEGGSPSNVLEGFANLPSAGGRAALRIAAYHEILGGYLDDVSLRRTNVDRTARDGVRAGLRVQATPDWTVDLSGAWQELSSSDTQYTTGRIPRRRANRVAESHRNRFTEVALNVRGTAGEFDVTSSTAYVRHAFGSLYDASAALDLFSGAAMQLGVYDERRRVEMLVQDLVFSSHGAARLGWLAGVYAAASKEDSPSRLDARPMRGPLSNLYAEARTDRLRTFAGYGEVTYLFAPGWTFAVGGRGSTVRVKVDSAVLAPAPGRSRRLQRTESFNAFAPKVSVQHDLSGGGLVYGLFSTAKRPGGVNSGGLFPLPPTRTTFAPDTLRNVEVGVKLHDGERRGSLQAAVFYDQWRNIQSDRYLSSGLAYTANVGDADVYGLEGEAAWRFDLGLSVRANLLLTGSHFARSNPDFAARLADGLPGAPTASGGLLVQYERPLSTATRLHLAGEAHYVGRSRLTFDAPRAVSMGDYVDAELSAGLAGEAWRADLFVLNPADSAADTFAYGNPFSFGQVRQATPQRPRTVGLTVARNF